MIKNLGFLVLFSGIALSSIGQSVIGFTSSAGFPTLISPGQTYQMGGWIENQGVDTLFGNIDILMAVNQGVGLPLQNNFNLPAPLAPGDSIFWSIPNFNFPNGHLAPGQNDVLIWPTASQGGNGQFVRSDSLEFVMYYAPSAAFSMHGCSDQSWATHGINMESVYDIQFYGENVGPATNTNSLRLWMQMDGSNPILLKTIDQLVPTNSPVQVEMLSFKLSNYLNGADYDLPAGYQTQVRFYIDEDNGLQHVTSLQYSAYTSVDLAASFDQGLLFFPNPSSNGWQVMLQSTQLEIIKMELFDLQGKMVKVQAEAGNMIDGSDLLPGLYHIRVTTDQGIVVKKLIKD